MSIDHPYLPEIPLEDLFTPIDLPEEKIPQRWWSMKTTVEYLGVSERTVKRYKAEGKLEYKYLMVKGHRKIYFTNISVISVYEDRYWKKQQREILRQSKNTECVEGDFTDEEEMKINAISSLLAGLLE